MNEERVAVIEAMARALCKWSMDYRWYFRCKAWIKLGNINPWVDTDVDREWPAYSDRATAAIDAMIALSGKTWKIVPVEATDVMSEASWESEGTDYVGEHHRICRFDVAYNDAIAAVPNPLADV
jgi:hypothetical protein